MLSCYKAQKDKIYRLTNYPPQQKHVYCNEKITKNFDTTCGYHRAQSV
jgi:hypothetical protein